MDLSFLTQPLGIEPQGNSYGGLLKAPTPSKLPSSPTPAPAPLPPEKLPNGSQTNTSFSHPFSFLSKPALSPLTPTPTTPYVKPATETSDSLDFLKKPVTSLTPKAPVPTTLDTTTAPKVRQQDFKDVGNLPFELALKPFVGLLSLGEAITGKPAPLGLDKIDAPFPHYKEVKDGDYTHQVPLEEPAVTSRRMYDDLIAKGATPDEAFSQTAVKTVSDMAMLVPIFKGVGKGLLLREAPQKLINEEIVSATRQQIRDFASGADTYAGKESPIPKPLQEAFLKATPEEKVKIVKGTGVDLVSAKPSLLGKLFGVSDEEANRILTELRGGPLRESAAEKLPGYRKEPGQAPAFGLSTERVEPVGFAGNPGKEAPFEGFKDLSTHVLDKLEGRTTVSKQFISDLTNSPDLKQPERDLIRKALESEGETVNVQDFADKVHGDLLPLERSSRTESRGNAKLSETTQYEGVTLPEDLRGPVANYSEHVYNSPIKTSAGDVHFGGLRSGGGADNYFAHSRIEDLPDRKNFAEYDSGIEAYRDKEGNILDPSKAGKSGSTRRIIEIQSDLFQKGRLEGEIANKSVMDKSQLDARAAEVAKLEPYRNTWHERLVREEVKQAAKDGKTKLQFPTGETAMKIEGLGTYDHWQTTAPSGRGTTPLDIADLKVGMEAWPGGQLDNNTWIITDVLGEGKFKAVPKAVGEGNDSISQNLLDNLQRYGMEGLPESQRARLQNRAETFDISGKVDKENPIYKFYEKEVGRYLKNKYQAELVTDAQGVSWWEVKVDPKAAEKPVTAFKKGTQYYPVGRGPKIETSKVASLLKGIVPEENIKYIFNPKMLDESGALGQFRGNDRLSYFTPEIRPVIELFETGGKVYVRTAFHEAWHYLESKVFSKEFVAKLNEETLAKMTPFDHSHYSDPEYNTPEKRAAEYRADEFAKSEAKKAGYTSPLEKVIEMIKKAIQKIVDAVKSLKEKFDAMPNKEGGFVRNPLDKGAPKELKIKQSVVEDANQEINRLYEQQGLAEKIESLEKRLDEVKMEKETTLQALEDHPAKPLIKYLSPATGHLPEITGKETMQSVSGSGKTTKTSEFGLRGDDILQNELGFKDLEEAEAALESYKDIRASLFATQKDLMSIRKELSVQKAFEKIFKADPQVREEYRSTLKQLKETERFRQLQARQGGGKGSTPSTTGDQSRSVQIDNAYGLSVPTSMDEVKPPEVRGGLSAPKLSFQNWSDKRALSLARETMERNIDRVAGDDAPAVREFLVEATRRNETERVNYANTLRNEIKDKVVKGFKIRAGSERDALVQQFGEKEFNLDHLQKLRPNDWREIKEASEYFRNLYDELLDRVNAERTKFGYKEIPKHQEYFRHFQEIDNIIQQFGLILREQDLPTEIAGITGIFNPGKPFTTAEMQRKGIQTTVSAVKGMDNYIDAITKQIYHIDSVQRGRALEKYIRESAKVAAKFASVPSEELHLSNFVANLHDHTNLLAGKKSALDRAFESILGRGIYGVTNTIRQRISANMVGGNISSAITNFIPFTQSLATTAKPAALRGLGEGLTAPFMEKFAEIGGETSNFLVRRFPEKAIDPRGWKLASERANWLFEAVDKFTARSLVAGKYFENLSKGLPEKEAMQEADNYAGKVMADRSLGQLPNLLSSKSLGFLTQFQTEVNNQFSFLTRDIPDMNEGEKLKMVSALAQFILYSYLFNEGYKKITGRRPTLDPIYAGLTLLGHTPESENDTLPSRFGTAGKDLANNLPFTGGLFGGRLPISSAIPSVSDASSGKSTWPKELLKPVKFLLPPFGGSQIGKTFEGGKALVTGQTETMSGKKKADIEVTPSNIAKGLLFGPSDLKESVEGNSTVSDLYGRLNSQKAGSSTLTKEAEDLDQTLQKMTPEEADKKAAEIQASNPELFTRLEKVVKDRELGLSQEERLMKQLGVANGERARYVDETIMKIPDDSEKDKYLNDLIAKKVVTPAVLEQLQKIRESGGSLPVVPDKTEASSSSIIDKAVTYAKAIGTDPVTAFNRIFTGQTIREVKNGTVIVERMSLKDSSAEAQKQLSATTTPGLSREAVKLDHTVPLELGGSNSKDNLRLVTTSEWATYTPIENLLGKALSDKTITKAKAQTLIRDFKSGKISAEEVRSALPKTNFHDETDYLEPITIKPAHAGIHERGLQPLAQSGLVTQALESVAENLPFFESPSGSKLKIGAFKEYPFRPDMQEALKDHTELTLASDVGEGADGIEMPFRNLDYIPGGKALADRLDRYGLIPEVVANWLLSQRGKRETVAVASNAVQTVAHELFHASAEETDFDFEKFNQAWESAPDKVKEAIDRHIENAGIYDPEDRESLGNERFAYLGETRGVGGLKAIPAELRPFYQKILR